ncbi:MAG TPA: serine/threonine-protein kinase, partial [Vicinamibacterales bacterium]|nr:serine/threonine-protein kinase [Vicinamibacterales bacterium]
MLPERIDALVGSMLGKDYRVLQVIGTGGMAVVYLVEHQTLLKRFAAKVLSSELASSAEARERFTQEAHAASQLDHENIVTISDFGVTADQRPFFVMELLRGQTLDQRLGDGPMSIEEVVAVAVPVARALSHAHHEGIVHRDVKPENIFLVQRSQGRWGVKVVDFGIAKTPINPKLTNMNETLGSPPFMAPEMIRGEDDAVDQRTDVYSFGVLLYLMLCGRLPFLDENLLKVMQMHLASPVPPPRVINPALPLALADVVDRALAKHPDDRYPSMAALLIDFEAALPPAADRLLIEAQSGTAAHATPFAGALPMTVTGPRPIARLSAPLPVARPSSPTPNAALPAAPRRSRAAVTVAIGALAVLVAAGAWYRLAGRLHAASERGDRARDPSALLNRPVESVPPLAAAPEPAAAVPAPAPAEVEPAAAPAEDTAPPAAPAPEEEAAAPAPVVAVAAQSTVRAGPGRLVPGKKPVRTPVPRRGARSHQVADAAPPGAPPLAVPTAEDTAPPAAPAPEEEAAA